ncbi:MAG: nuclear transport factor 2 family protein [Deltaproteobacteria bacterium]|nr:nuclear transport factor 2 family protein [Deltaproteobacteria bacterium]
MSSRKGRTTGKSVAKKGSARKSAAGKGTAKKASKAKAGTTKKRAAAKGATKKSAPKPFVPVLSGPEKLAIVERYIAAYNGRDTATILSLYAPKATMEDPLGLPPAVGHKAIAGLYQMGFDMNVTIAHDGAVRCAGNSVAFPLIASSPSSKLHVIDVFDFGRGGKIVSMRAYWGPDNLEGDLAVRQA